MTAREIKPDTAIGDFLQSGITMMINEADCDEGGKRYVWTI